MAKSKSGNLYHRILKLPQHITQPDAYQLLGIPQFEQDVIKIKQAAMDRNQLLQRKQNAENYKDVKRIEREIGEALVRLTNPESKADYDRHLESAVSLMEPPPQIIPPENRDTKSLTAADDGTIEVELLPEDFIDEPTGAHLPPIPRSGVHKFPAPAGNSTKTEKKSKAKKDRKQKAADNAETPSSVPGEAPWSLSSSWWQSQSPIVKGLVVGLPLVLVVGSLIAFWASRSNEEPQPDQIAEKEELEQPVVNQKPIEAASKDLLTSRVLFREPSGGLEDVAMAADGRWIATLGRDGAVRLWDKFSGSVRVLDLPTFNGKPLLATSLAATPDGNQLYAATGEDSLLEWPLSGLPGTIATIPKIHAIKESVHSLQVTGDGQLVVGLGPASHFVVFRRSTSQTGVESPKIRGGVASNVLATRPNSDRMAVFCTDQTIRLWKPKDTSSDLPSLVGRKLTKPEIALAYSPDGSHLAAAGGDHQIRLDDLNDPKGTPILFTGHTDRIYSLSFSPDGNLLASAGVDRSVRLWDAKTGKELVRLGGHKQPILSVEFSQQGEAFYTASLDGTVRRWSVAGSAVPPAPILPAEKSSPRSKNLNRITNTVANRLAATREFTLPSPQSSSSLLSPSASELGIVSPDGMLLARREVNGRIVIYDAQTARRRHNLPVSTHSSVAACFSSDGQTFLVAQNDGWLSSWDMATGGMVDRVSHSTLYSSSQSIANSRQNDRVAVPDGSRGVRIHTDLNDLSQSVSLRTGSTCQHLSITPDGQYLAAHVGRQIEIWNLGDPAAPLNPSRTQTIDLPFYSGASNLALSPNAETCVLGMNTGKMIVYSTQNGDEVASFTGHSRTIHSLAFDPEGKMLFSAGADDDVRVWNAVTWGGQLARLPKLGSVPSANPSGRNPAPGGIGRIQPPGGLSQSTDPVAGFQLTDDAKQVVVLHESGAGVVWEVGENANPIVAASPAPSDLKISGPPQTLEAKNIAAITEWEEFTAHRHTVTHMEFTPDQKFLLTAGVDGAIRFWDAQTGAYHHFVSLTGSASSSSAPSLPGATGGNSFYEYLGAGAAPSPAPMGVGTGTIRRVAVSSANLMAASTDGRSIRLWETDSGKNQGTLGGGTKPFTWFGFSPDGKTLITQSGTDTLEFWDLSDRKPPTPQSVPTGITAADVCPVIGPYLFATGNSRGDIRLWKSPTEHTDTKGNLRPIQALKFSPDGKHLAAWDLTGAVQIWDLETNTKTATQQWANFRPNDMQFTPKSDELLLISENGMLRALSVDPDKTDVASQPGKLVDANRIAVSFDGKLLALTRTETGLATSQPGKVQLFGVGGKPSELSPQGYTQTPLVAPQSTVYVHPQAISRINVKSIAELKEKQIQAHPRDVWSLDYFPDGSAFVSGGSDSMAYVWDAFSRKKIQTLKGHIDRVRAVAASPDNKHVVTASRKGVMKLWNRFDGTEVLSRLAHGNTILDLAFSSDGSSLATASQDRTIKVWTTNSLAEQKKLTGHTDSVTGVTWLTDAELVSVDRDNNVFLWDPLRGKIDELPGHGTAMEGIASTKGRKIAFASNRGTVGLFTNVLVVDGKKAWTRLTGHRGPVQAVAFSPDESVLVSVGTDLTLKFWNTDTGALLRTLAGPETKIHCLCFSPDGRWLITGGADGIIRIWGLQ